VAAHGTPSPSAPKEVEHSAAPAETAAPIENFAPRAPAALEPKRAIVAERGAKAAPEPETPKVQPEAMAPPPAPEASAPPPETASTVFERANIARRHGDNAGAIAAYRDLQSRYPGSSEARLSIAVVARMQLDSGNPSAALAGFDAYLRTGHAMLREEAMAGRALALERLGRTADARQAWSAFVASYPRSAYARHAEKLLRDPTE
jgi:TolA-binding protein